MKIKKYPYLILLAPIIDLLPVYATENNQDSHHPISESQPQEPTGHEPISIIGAGNHPIAPQQVLEIARSNAANFIRLMSDMGRRAAELHRTEELYGYLLILDELYEIGTGYGFNDPVLSAGYKLSAEAVKWLDMTRDSEELVQQFIKYSEGTHANAALTNNQSILDSTSDLKKLLTFHARCHTILGGIEGRRKDKHEQRWLPAYITESAQSLQGAVVNRILLLYPTLSDQEISFLIEKSTSGVALSKMLSQIQDLIFESYRHIDLNETGRWLLSIAKVMQDKKPTLPLDELNRPGDLALEILKHMLFTSPPLNAQLFLDFLPFLSERQVLNFSNIFASAKWEGITAEKSASYLIIAGQMLKKMKALHLITEYQNLEQFITKLKINSQINLIEGLYKVHIGEQQAFLSLFHLGEAHLAGGLRLMGKKENLLYQDYTFFNINYNFEKDEFEAQRFLVQTPQNIPLAMMTHFTFKIAAKKITGQFFKGGRNFPMEGEKSHSLPMIGHKIQNDVEFTGIFSNEELSLDINKSNTNYAASLRWKESPIVAHLNYGYANETDHILYLTAGEHDSARLIHVRVYFINDHQIEMQYFIAGEKNLPKTTILSRQSFMKGHES